MIEYFPHDYHARSDPKLLKLRMKYGFEGVGIYWSIIEMLFEAGGIIMLSECERIAYELRVDIERIAAIIGSDLFNKNDTYFWSDGVHKRISIREDKSQKARESAHKRWDNKDLKSNANALRTHSEGNAIKEKKRKENIKEIKLKKTTSDEDNKHLCNSETDIGKFLIPELIPDTEPEQEKQTVFKRSKKPEFIPPTENEFTDYFKSNGYKTDIALRAFKGYSESGWKDSQGKPVLNWKQKCQHVWFKDEHKSKHKSREQEIEDFERGAEQYRKDGWNVV